MKAYTPLALSALLSLVMATPVVKREDVVVVETVVDEIVVTVDVTTTITGFPAPSPKPNHAHHLAYHANNGGHKHVAPPPPPKPAPAKPEEKAAVPAPAKPEEKVAAPAPQPAPQPAPVKPEEKVAETPEQIQEAEDNAQIATNNKQKAADFAHQNEMIQLQNGGQGPSQPAPSQPAPSPAAPSPDSQPPPESNPPPTSGSGSGGGGSCGSVGGSCSGDVTIYNDVGAGACGWTMDPNSQDYFALAEGMFGTYTNDAPGNHKNAFCGRMATIVVNGKSFTGKLTDRCGGCEGQSIDLSQHLFSQIWPDEPPGNGRYHDISWHFTSEPIYDGPN